MFNTALLRQNEAAQLYQGVEDLITKQLMGMASMCVLNRYFKKGALPASDLDMRFFMEIIYEFCTDHKTLRAILSGESKPSHELIILSQYEAEQSPKLLNQDAAKQILSSVSNPITKQLMGIAASHTLIRFKRRERLPITDFDFRFFIEVLHEFCNNHNVIRRVLAGEDLRWWPDDAY